MTGDEPLLCVAVVTRDRRELIVQALASVCEQLGPRDELVVVDNGSRDGTREKVTSWLTERCPAGRLVYEPAGGVSAGRNAVLRDAAAPIVCFLDDDERAHPGWLGALRRAWAESGPRVAVIGGPMHPDWQAPRPAWLADYLLYVVTILDLGPERRLLDQGHRGYAWGGNMSVRVSAARELGGFDVEQGPRPEKPHDRGEEEDLQRRLAAAGWEVWYEPAAAIDHVIPEARLRVSSFRTFFRQRGLLEAEAGAGRLAALPVLARAAARYVLLRLRRDPLAVTATFTLAYGWARLTAPRRPRGDPSSPPAARA